METREKTAQAWGNAGKVKSVEEYYQKVGATPEVSADSIKHTHEEAPKPKRRRTRRKS